MNALRTALRRQQRSLATTGRRYASFYNTDVAGLNEDQMEVRDGYLGRCLLFTDVGCSSEMQWQTLHRKKLLPELQMSTSRTTSQWLGARRLSSGCKADDDEHP